jgi:hypothetical protein
MSPSFRMRHRTRQRVTLAIFLGAMASTAMAQTIEGTATYRERIALPRGAVLEATLEDVSRADAGEVERVFREALKSAKRLTITEDRLELFDAAGNSECSSLGAFGLS